MEALDLLLNRRSQPRLQDPPPKGDELENILQAGLAAPDHKSLTPWEFVVCTGNGLNKLGEIFKQAAIENSADQSVVERAPTLPLRAPMIIVAICRYKEHEKVPWVEQVASTSCSVQAMQMAALAQGFQGVWRTGWYAKDKFVKQAFDCAEKDEIVGFLYLGTTPLSAMRRPKRDSAVYTQHWS